MPPSPAAPHRAAPLHDIPPVWMLLCIALMLGLHTAVPVLECIAPQWRWPGALLLVVALSAMLHSVLRFARAGTGVRPFAPVTALVSTGAFRWTRNPMYLGMVSCTLGIAVMLGTLTPLAGPPLLLLVLDRHFVRREEAFLRQHLGAPYDDYCRRVRRWL